MQIQPLAVRHVLKRKQASSILKKAGRVFFESARYKFDSTLEVCATKHYIKNSEMRRENKFTQCKKSSPNLFGPAGSKRRKAETANALI
jgi:hypothetical protein